jgi:hypothetical protein
MIEGDEIGKRAADIDGDGVTHKNSRSRFKVQSKELEVSKLFRNLEL